MALLERIRPDVKFLANQLLMKIPELQDRLIPVDPFNPC
jgi:putative hemolysin